MNWFPFFLAWRYMWGSAQEHTIGTMVRVSCIAVALGSGALALTMCVMRGFEQSTHQLLQGIHAPLTISAGGNPLDYKAIGALLQKEFPQVAAYSPSDTQHAIIKDPVSGELSAPIMLQGILPEHEQRTTQLTQFIIHSTSPTHKLPALLDDKQIIIGTRLAQQLELMVGDTIELVYAPETTSSHKLYLSTTPVTITGIFKTGLEEVDAGVVYTSLPFLQTLFTESDVTSIALSPLPTADQHQLKKQLRNRFGLIISSWQDMYPALVSALQLESYAMFLILSLIILVASMSLIALLYMQIQHKRGDIAILYTLGVPQKIISRTFIVMGVAIASISCIIGLLFAGVIALGIDHYKLISLPESYLIEYLPISIEPVVFAGIFLFVVLISLIATWIPTRSLKNIKVTTLLRN